MDAKWNDRIFALKDFMIRQFHKYLLKKKKTVEVCFTKAWGKKSCVLVICEKRKEGYKVNIEPPR